MKKLAIATIFLTILLFIVVQAQASTVSFSDNTIYWPGYPGQTSSIDNTDENGVPKFKGGRVDFSGATLTDVAIGMKWYDNTNSLLQHLAAGDLFIDINADQTWDYVVHESATGGQALWGIKSGGSPIALGTYSPVKPDYYEYSNDTWVWSGTPRKYHPVNIIPGNTDLEELHGVTFSDDMPGTLEGDGLYYIYWAGLNIDTGGNAIILGWTINCANDVIYEKIPAVPIPGAIWLLFSGSVGLLGLKKRFLS